LSDLPIAMTTAKQASRCRRTMRCTEP
jgi:hypothetical protein